MTNGSSKLLNMFLPLVESCLLLATFPRTDCDILDMVLCTSDGNPFDGTCDIPSGVGVITLGVVLEEGNVD